MAGWFSSFFPSDFNLTTYWGDTSLLGGDAGLDPGISVGALKLTGDGDGSEGPFIDVFTIPRLADGSWAAPPTVTPHVRVGKLTGVLGGVVGEWGMAAGNNLANDGPTAQYIVASTLGIKLKNAGLQMYSGANQTVNISPNGEMKLGTNITADATVTFAHNPATGNLRVGPQAAGKPNLFWNNTTGTLSLRQNTTDIISLRADGTSSFVGPVSLGPNGGIWQGVGPGTPTFENPRNGLKIWNEGGKGRIAIFDDGTQRVTLRESMGLEVNSGAPGYDRVLSFTDWTGSIYGGMTASSSPGGGGVRVSSYMISLNDFNTAGLFLDMSGVLGVSVTLRAGAAATGATLKLNAGLDVITVSNSNFYIKEKGLAVGYTANPSLGRGVIATDLAGEHSNPHIVLQDTGQIAHGMTSVASTSTYANFRKMDDEAGGLRVTGLSEGDRALDLYGYATYANTTTGTGALAPVMVSAYKKSGTDGGSAGSTANIFVVRDTSNARFIVKGNGDFHYDGTGAAYDDHDDVGLLRVLSRELWAGTVNSMWDKFVTVNRQNLIDAGIMSDGGFINGAALSRLLTGAIWQLNERLSALEGKHD